MKSVLQKMAQGFKVKKDAEKVYKRLRKHLDTLPVGYPSTLSGVELRLLSAMFTVEEAKLATILNWRKETFEQIEERAVKQGYERERLLSLLDSMDRKGAIFVTMAGKKKYYALHPFVIGMFEMQLKRLTPNYYLDTRDYMLKSYAAEYYGSVPRQMRVIPVQRSVTPQMAIAAYDDIREIVDRTKDRIGVTDCICKVAKESVGLPCKVTDRRDVCMGFRDFHDIYARHGWGRTVSKKEAMAILDRNEKEGLVLMPSTMQQPQFVCSCCSCCCGIMELVGTMPRPADLVESNYRAVLKTDLCTGCGRCAKRCQMGAIVMEGNKAVAVDAKKCVGCGVCVATCKANSLSLARKEIQFVPPLDIEALYEHIDDNRKSKAGKMTFMARAAMGLNTK